MKILPMGFELLHADRHVKAKSRFSKLCERAQKQQPDTVPIFSPLRNTSQEPQHISAHKVDMLRKEYFYQ
jgi:hypothetical protein